MDQTTSSFFTRKATGLVRELSLIDAFVFNVSFVNVGLAVLYMTAFVPAWHPGGSMVLAVLIATIMAIPTALTYGMLAAAFPRSGGEYVYISRNISPALGFAASWNLVMWGLFYIGTPCTLFSSIGLTALFRFAGVSLNSPSLLLWADQIASPFGTFVFGFILLAVIIFLYILGVGIWAKVQDYFFLAAVIGLLLIIGVLLANDNIYFIERFNEYILKAGGKADAFSFLLVKSKEYGFSEKPFSLIMTLLVLAWPCYNLFWANASTYFGSEVRRPARTQVLSLPLAVICSGIFMIVLLASSDKTLGNGFLASLGWVKPAEIGLKFHPSFPELCAIIGGPFVGLMILFFFLYWTWAWAPLAIAAVTRSLLAWSVDGLIPAWFSKVNPRLHSPIQALVTCGILGALFILLSSFVPAFSIIVGVVGVFLTFIIGSFAAVLFPFKRKSEFESSPVNWRLGRIPVISLLGCLSIFFLLCAEVVILLDPVSGISIFPSVDAGTGKGIPFAMLLINLGVLGSGFVVYIVIKSIQKLRGIDVELAFKEIPPE